MIQPTEIVRYPKAVIFRQIGYKIYADEVRRMHESNARVKIISAPARTSKSTSAAADAAPEVFPEFGIVDGQAYPLCTSDYDDTKHIWIVAPHFSLAKEFDYLWQWFVEKRKSYGWAYEVEKAQRSPEQGHMQIQLNFGKDPEGRSVRTLIQVRTGANDVSLQSEEVHLGILSEAADQPERVWTKYLSTRVKRSIWPTTPKPQADWIRQNIEMAKNDPSLQMEHFEYDGRCNPRYDWERYWLEHMKAESRQSAKDRTKPRFMHRPPSHQNGHGCFSPRSVCAAQRDPHFAEQFMGRWTYAESRVLAFRWSDINGRMSHILDEEPHWLKYAEKYVTVDYGFSDPAAAVFFAVDADGTVVAFDEIYERGLEPDRFVRQVHDYAKSRGIQVRRYFSDPQKPEVLRYLQRLHLPVFAVDAKRQRDRQAGYMILQDYLSDDPMTGRPKLFLTRNCQNGIREARQLHRKENHSGNEFSTGAIAGDDHWWDAMRYALTTFPRGKSLADRMLEQNAINLFALAEQNRRRGASPPRGYLVGASGVIH